MRSRRSFRFLVAAIVVAAAASSSGATTFNCAGGDTVCLINAIRTANVLGGPNIINLGSGTYHLRSVNNTTIHGPNALPVIFSNVTLQGAGASVTTLQRDPGVPDFRTLEVSGTATLYLRSLTIQGRDSVSNADLSSWGGLGLLNFGVANLSDVIVRGETGTSSGGGIRNDGFLSAIRILVESNEAFSGSGGGILNEGTMQITRSTIRNNRAMHGDGGGIYTGPGPITIVNSAITDNIAGGGGGVTASGSLTMTGSTIARNSVADGSGRGGIRSGGATRLTNCTVADNVVSGALAEGGGGILSYGGVSLQNTILARNTWFHGFEDPPYSTPWDCDGAVSSLGHNIVGDTFGCTIALQSTDYVGDAKLGIFADQIKAADGSLQGNGQIPLLAGSPAIDAGDYNTCTRTDQLGYPRVDANLDCGQTCDVGAVEYAPVVNSWISPVAFGSPQRNPTPIPGYPSGTVTITRTYKNNVLNIAWPVFALTSLSSNAVLLNGDPPNAGGVGARLTPNVGTDSVWSPGETIGVTWVFGLKSGSFASFSADAVGFPDYP